MPTLQQLQQCILQVANRNRSDGCHRNALPELIRVWQDSVDGRESHHILLGLQRCLQRRDAVSWLQTPSTGLRCIWWPKGMVSGQLVCVLSSRIGRDWSTKQAWVSFLRQIVTGLEPRREVLLTSPKTTCDPFVSILGSDGIQPLVVVCPMQDTNSTWLRECLAAPSTPANPSRAIVSPPLEAPAITDSVPVGDACLLALADVAFVLRLRPNGNLCRLLTQMMPHADLLSVRLVMQTGEIGSQIAEDLLRLGATRYDRQRGIAQCGKPFECRRQV